MFRITSCAAFAFFASAAAALAQSADDPAVSSQRVDRVEIDYARARPLPLPGNSAAPAAQADLIGQGSAAAFSGPAGVAPGKAGSGKLKAMTLPKSRYVEDGGVASAAYGTSNHPFTTATQADSSGDPYRRAGKLFFTDNGSFICSASMIRRGLALTAAHCVSDFGKNRFYSGFEYVPAYNNGYAPFGRWYAQKVYALKSYLKGTAKCATKGVVCENDIALIVLKPQNNQYAGDYTGYFGYGYGGYSYNKNNQVMITQLGYPGSLNGGEQMMRTDSQGSVSKSESGNTIIGSLQTGGSSGGPWIVNFGFEPVMSDGVKAGKDALRMIVVGATSWGYTNQAVKEQGASPFTADNLKVLIDAACGAYPNAC